MRSIEKKAWQSLKAALENNTSALVEMAEVELKNTGLFT